MDITENSFLRVFCLINIPIVPTVLIYLLLAEHVGEANFGGEIWGYTISFGGPLAFYIFIVFLFRGWATLSANRRQLITSQEQEKLELLSDYEKTRVVHEINGEIAILEKQRKYLEALLNKDEALELPEITQVRL